MSETSAGAVIYTLNDSDVIYLVIEDNHGNFGFPKGHLEKDETLNEAALREIKEETGIDAEILTDFTEELNYVMPNGILKKAVYFIGRYSDQEPVRQEEEVRQILLLNCEDALNILTFDSMKEVLIKADACIRKKEGHE